MTCQTIIFAVLAVCTLVSANLEHVPDEELEKLIANEKFVITLFRSGKFLRQKQVRS